MTPARKRVETPFRRLLRRAAWVAGGVGVLAFAVQAGEYSTLDVVRSRTRVRERVAQLDSLQRVVDSLKAEYAIVTTDVKRLERMAREEFGMVRGDKELLYWVGGAARPDSDGATLADTAPAGVKPPVRAPAKSAAAATKKAAPRG